MKVEIVEAEDMAGVHHLSSVDEAIGYMGKCSKINKDFDYIETCIKTGRGYRSNQYWWGIDGDADEVKELAMNGWAAGVEKVREQLGHLSMPVEPIDIKRRKKRGDFGDDVDMQRIYAGDIERAWSTTSKVSARAPKNISMLIDMNLTAGTTSEVLFWRGAVAVWLSDHLTDAGFSVEINGVEAGKLNVDGKPKYATFLPIKEALMPLDLPSVASTVCMAGFYRLAMFCRLICDKRKVYGGLNYPKPLSEVYPNLAKEPGVIYGFNEIRDKRTAEDFIKKNIEKLSA